MFSKSRLKAKREEFGLSQNNIAIELAISRVAYNHWESGKTVPNQKHLTALAKILDVPVTYFDLSTISSITIFSYLLTIRQKQKTL